jgi:hypothetical protein
MFTSMSPPAQTLPKLPAQMSRLDVPLDELPQPPRDSSQSASAEHFRNPVLCLAVLPLYTGHLGKEALRSVPSLVRRDGPQEFVGNM